MLSFVMYTALLVVVIIYGNELAFGGKDADIADDDLPAPCTVPLPLAQVLHGAEDAAPRNRVDEFPLFLHFFVSGDIPTVDHPHQAHRLHVAPPLADHGADDFPVAFQERFYGPLLHLGRKVFQLVEQAVG